MSEGSAAAWILFVIILVFSLAQFKFLSGTRVLGRNTWPSWPIGSLGRGGWGQGPMLTAVSFVLCWRWQRLAPPAGLDRVTGFKPEPEIIRLPIRWLPVHATTENFGIACNDHPDGRTSGGRSSTAPLVAVAETLLILAFDRRGGLRRGVAAVTEGGARLRRHRGELMVPVQITLVPLYLIFAGAGWLNSIRR